MTASDIARLVESGDEHIARERYGDSAVDDWFLSVGWNPQIARGSGVRGCDILSAAAEFGARDRSFGYAALTAHSTSGARLSMIGMARSVLGIAHDPTDAVVDALADAYWSGKR